jgi:hypothetical protein
MPGKYGPVKMLRHLAGHLAARSNRGCYLKCDPRMRIWRVARRGWGGETGAFRRNPIKCVPTIGIGLKTRDVAESVDRLEFSLPHAALSLRTTSEMAVVCACWHRGKSTWLRNGTTRQEGDSRARWTRER